MAVVGTLLWAVLPCHGYLARPYMQSFLAPLQASEWATLTLSSPYDLDHESVPWRPPVMKRTCGRGRTGVQSAINELNLVRDCFSSENGCAAGRRFCPSFRRASLTTSAARRRRFAPTHKAARCGWRPPRECPATSRDESAGSRMRAAACCRSRAGQEPNPTRRAERQSRSGHRKTPCGRTRDVTRLDLAA